jgi:meso-butanediol dehydrogenase / (S,S)-butanediol dehydrogenase / diacetyl reductase
MTAKDVLMTGATGAIGGAITRRLAKQGYIVHLAGRDVKALEVLLSTLPAAARGVRQVLDLSDANAAIRVTLAFFRTAVNPFGLVCAAGTLGEVGPYSDISLDAWFQGFTCNFLSHAGMIQTFVKEMKARRAPGSIINFSGAGLGGATDFSTVSSYSTAKAALIHLTEALAPELASLGLRINSIAPGPVESRMTDQALAAGAKAGQYAAAAMKVRESGGVSPELAADLAEWLLSDESKSVNGRFLSARFDLPTLKQRTVEIQQDTSLYRLRRIDENLFGAKK